MCIRDRSKIPYSHKTGKLLPCLCVACISSESSGSDDRNTHNAIPFVNRSCDILWCHKRVRNNGLATLLCNKLNVVKACGILEESEGFWEKFFNDKKPKSKS